MPVIKKLLATIDSELEKRGITKGEAAKRIGVSGGTLSNYFKRKHKIGYLTFIELTKAAYGKYNHELIRKFAEHAKAKVDIEAMEWAYANFDTSVLEILIRKDKENSKENIITKLYELRLKRIKGDIDSESFFEEVEDLRYEFKHLEHEALVLLGICTVYNLVDTAAYNAVQPKARNLLKQIQRLENSYLKKAYSMRIKLALSLSAIRSGDLHTAEVFAKEVTTIETYNMFPLYYNNALIYLSEIYLFRDFEKSVKYIKEAVKMMDEGLIDENPKRKSSIKATYDFIHLYNNHFQGLYLEDPAERAHYYAKQKNSEEKRKAVDILNDLFNKKGKLSNFQMYYKALALNDLRLMMLTKDCFYRSGDFHYVKLPNDFIEYFNK